MGLPYCSKDEVLDKFPTFLALVENQIDKTLKFLRSDNGGEYVSKAFQEFCDRKGIRGNSLPLIIHPKMDLQSV